MNTYIVWRRWWVNDTSAEYGYGDYARWDTERLGQVEAPTMRQAQALAKRTWPQHRLRFSGVGASGNIMEESEWSALLR